MTQCQRCWAGRRASRQPISSGGKGESDDPYDDHVDWSGVGARFRGRQRRPRTRRQLLVLSARRSRRKNWRDQMSLFRYVAMAGVVSAFSLAPVAAEAAFTHTTSNLKLARRPRHALSRKEGYSCRRHSHTQLWPHLVLHGLGWARGIRQPRLSHPSRGGRGCSDRPRHQCALPLYLLRGGVTQMPRIMTVHSRRGRLRRGRSVGRRRWPLR